MIRATAVLAFLCALVACASSRRIWLDPINVSPEQARLMFYECKRDTALVPQIPVAPYANNPGNYGASSMGTAVSGFSGGLIQGYNIGLAGRQEKTSRDLMKSCLQAKGFIDKDSSEGKVKESIMDSTKTEALNSRDRWRQRMLIEDPKFMHKLNALDLAEKGHFDEAIAEYRAALRFVQMADEISSIHEGLGNVMVRKDDLDGAIKEYEAAIQLNPRAASAHALLGGAFYKKSVQDHRDADEYEKGDQCQLNGANQGEAIKELRNESVFLNGTTRDRSMMIHEASRVKACPLIAELELRSLKERDAAIDSMRAGVHLEPNNAIYHAFLGKALSMNVLSIDAAIKEYQEALRLDPNLTKASDEFHELEALWCPDHCPR
jgi:tetratricopeptide (TPR) repeat protein